MSCGSVRPCAFSCALYFASLPLKYCCLIWSIRAWMSLSVTVMPSVFAFCSSSDSWTRYETAWSSSDLNAVVPAFGKAVLRAL